MKLEIKDGLKENREYINKLNDMIFTYRDSIASLDNLGNSLDYHQL